MIMVLRQNKNGYVPSVLGLLRPRSYLVSEVMFEGPINIPKDPD